MENIVKENFSRGQPLDQYDLGTTSTTKLAWPTATLISFPPRFSSFFSRSAATRRMRTRREVFQPLAEYCMSDVGMNRIGDKELSTFPSHKWTSLIRQLRLRTYKMK